MLGLGVACSKPPQNQVPAQDSVPVQSTAMVSDTPPPADTVLEAKSTWDVPVDALLGKIEPGKDSGFVKVEQQYSSKPDIYMRKAAYESFKLMHAAAAKDGIKLVIISATRPFSYQKNIWEAKWSGRTLVGGKNLSVSIPDPEQRALKILEYSSMPNTSRHHWGTDIDLNNLENSYFASGEGKKIYDWLCAHGAEYGFCQTYTAMGPDRPNGYHEEKWHWSYMPIAAHFLTQYQAKVQYKDITGFSGSEVAEKLKVIEHYVGGIGPACKSWK